MNIKISPSPGFMTILGVGLDLGNTKGFGLAVSGSALLALGFAMRPDGLFMLIGFLLGIPFILLGLAEVFWENGIDFDKSRNTISLWGGLRTPGSSSVTRFWTRKRYPLDQCLGVRFLRKEDRREFFQVSLVFPDQRHITFQSRKFFTAAARAQQMALFLGLPLQKDAEIRNRLDQGEETRTSFFRYALAYPEIPQALPRETARIFTTRTGAVLSLKIRPDSFLWVDLKEFAPGVGALLVPLAVGLSGPARYVIPVFACVLASLFAASFLMTRLSSRLRPDELNLTLTRVSVQIRAFSFFLGRKFKRIFYCPLTDIEDILLVGVPMRGRAGDWAAKGAAPLLEPMRTFPDTGLLILAKGGTVEIPLILPARDAWEVYRFIACELAKRAGSAGR